MGQSGSVKHLKSLKYLQRKATYPSKSQLGESGDYKKLPFVTGSIRFAV